MDTTAQSTLDAGRMSGSIRSKYFVANLLTKYIPMSKEDKTVHWNYRVMRYTDGHGDETYGIYAVYYDQQGDITGYSATPSFPIGDTLEELREDFNNMLLAYGKPVIDHKE